MATSRETVASSLNWPGKFSLMSVWGQAGGSSPQPVPLPIRSNMAISPEIPSPHRSHGWSNQLRVCVWGYGGGCQTVLRATTHRSQRDLLLALISFSSHFNVSFQILRGTLKFVCWQPHPKLPGVWVLPGLLVGEVLCHIKYIRNLYCWAK